VHTGVLNSQAALNARVEVAWDKLRREVDDRAEQFDAVKHLVSSSLLDLAEAHRTDFDSRMSLVEGAGTSIAHAKCDQLTSAEQQTYFQEVPALVQRLIGPARQQMQTSHEAFDVENTKVFAREICLLSKIEQFNTSTQARVEVERVDRMRQFHMAAEQLSMQLLQPVRLDRQRQRSTVMQGVKKIQNALHHETKAREDGDAFIAGSLTKATHSLQKTVMENFGSLQETDSDSNHSATSDSDSD